MLPFSPLMRTLFLSCTIFVGACEQGTKTQTAPTVTANDLIPDNVFTDGIEGPAVDKHGNLYAVNFQQQGTIGFVSSELLTEGITSAAEKSQAKLFSQLPEGSIGNGIRFDKDGTMYVADYVGHNILKKKPEEQSFSVHAHDDNMNQPNDIAITSSGIIFASDPNWEKSTGQLWKITPDGKTHLLESDMGTTNGVEVSVDEKFLYVNESVQRKVWRYDLDKAGNISNKTLFYTFEDFGLDGMRSDIKGNIYIARYGAGLVVALSPKGEIVANIKLKGEKPTNVAFGGKDGKTLFITLQDRGAIEYAEALHPGRALNLR